MCPNQQTVVVYRNELVERTTAGRVEFAPLPSIVWLILPDSDSIIDIIKKNLRRTQWLFLGILDHTLNYDGQFEFLLICSPNYEATWKPRCNEPKTKFQSILLVSVGQYRTSTNDY